MQYEICYLVGESHEADLETIKAEVNNLLAQEGATLTGIEVAEKRKLAYQIKHDIRGTYVAQRFELPEKDDDNHKPEAIQNITRHMNLKQNVFRFIIVKADELPALKIREERAPERPRTDARRRPMREERKPAPREELVKKEEVPVAAPAQEKTETPAGEIDKKLDEILNI